MKTFQAQSDGDTLLKVDAAHIEITPTDSSKPSAEFTPTEEQQIPLALAVLGDPPPLQEALGSPEDLAKDKSVSDGELRFHAIQNLIALELRAESIRSQTAKSREEEAARALEEKARERQIDLLESAYIKTLTKRRWSTAQSRAIATVMYNQGARIADPEDMGQDEETPDGGSNAAE